MSDPLARTVSPQFVLGNVGFMGGTVTQQPVPWLGLRRGGDRYLLMPGVSLGEFRIHIHDHTTVSELLVLDQLSDVEE